MKRIVRSSDGLAVKVWYSPATWQTASDPVNREDTDVGKSSGAGGDLAPPCASADAISSLSAALALVSPVTFFAVASARRGDTDETARKAETIFH